MMRNRRALVLGFIWILVIVLVAGWQSALRRADTRVQTQNDNPGRSYVYLFDKVTSTFVFTFTHPELDASLWDVEVVPGSNPTELWFTERGADRLGQLVYTDTQDYVYQPYPLPAGSDPLYLVLDGDYVWFTAPGRNAIGRLDRTTGTTAEFSIPTDGSAPTDLDVADDGSLWFTEHHAGQIAHLVVTSTTTYQFDEYQGSSFVGRKPYGIVAHGTDAVYFTEMEKDNIVLARPKEDNWFPISDPFHVYDLDGPFRIVQESMGKVWVTEYTGNSIGMARIETSWIVKRYPVAPSNSRPHSLVLDGREIWFTQEGAGQLGHLIPADNEVFYYPLPVPNLNPRGISKDSGEFWLVASRPYKVCLPLVLR